MMQVPLYDASGRLLMRVAAEWAEANAGLLRLVRTRRARAVVRAYLRSDDSELVQWLEATGRRSGYGCAFEQQLPCGRRLWALRGVRGSR